MTTLSATAPASNVINFAEKARARRREALAGLATRKARGNVVSVFDFAFDETRTPAAPRTEHSENNVIAFHSRRAPSAAPVAAESNVVPFKRAA